MERMGNGSRTTQSGRSNLRTALVLASIALVFFIGVIVNRMLFN